MKWETEVLNLYRSQ